MNTQTTTTIVAEPRVLTSKGANRKLRLNGFLPGTLYSKGAATTITVTASSLPKEHTRAHVITLNLAGASRTVLMREVQVDPLTDKPLHFDFQEVAQGDTVNAHVPLKFVGFTREQEKEGTLGVLVRYLDVTVPLAHLPTSLDVNVSTLKAGTSVRLFDLQLPAELKVKTGKGKNVALASLITVAA